MNATTTTNIIAKCFRCGKCGKQQSMYPFYRGAGTKTLYYCKEIAACRKRTKDQLNRS